MSSWPTPIVHGYLVLADISGYTSFLSRTELDHAQEILSDLLETAISCVKPLVTIHKIEGGAVFAYGPLARLTLRSSGAGFPRLATRFLSRYVVERALRRNWSFADLVG